MSLNIIQKKADIDFPAQEIWLDNNNNFWTFSVNEETNTVYFTDGKIYNDNTLTFDTNSYNPKNIDDFIQDSINNKINQNYFCVAIQL